MTTGLKGQDRPEDDPGAEVINATNRAQQKEARRREKMGRRIQIEEVRHVMSSYAGRSFLNNLLVECRVFRVDFDGDPHWNSFWTGMREIGCRVMEDCRAADVVKFGMMIAEAERRAAAVTVRRKNPQKQTDAPGEQEDEPTGDNHGD